MSGRYKLKFDLQSRSSGKCYYAEYSTFYVFGETTNYLMHSAGYSGNAGRDSLAVQNGMMFTTYDRDNDRRSGNCAALMKSGFWF